MADEPFLSHYYFSSATFTSARVHIHNFYSFSNNIFQQLQNFHESILFIIPTVTVFLQLKNLFLTHPKTMGLALCASLVYYLARSGQLSFSVGGVPAVSVARHCMVWAGNLLVVSLVSILIPDSVRPLLYFLSVLVSAREGMRWLYKRILDTGRGSHTRRSQYLARPFHRMAPNSFFEPPQILPR